MHLAEALAQELRNRDNAVPMGVQTGTVIKDLPDVEVKINHTTTILYKENLVFSRTGKNAIYPNPTAVGMQVVLVPTTDEQTYYLLDEVVEIE
ncbi:hypothetical protein BP422_13060 [Brevibacillus formosus]|uniref:DUF2577 domain-containing protein n=1 Tax=Brevibacillus formosus TaxID=54913 RepID=A0A220MHF1_9BACL|nr:DUF2577 family protein [Brevibacillus formosus]ASJ54403.1 hypothetical protein BP422_13060 [Brevibacillus formosus]